MKLSPRNAKTERNILAMNRTFQDTENYWLSVHEEFVTLTRQRSGEPRAEMMSIPKKEFNKLIDFYNRDQVIRNTK